jgi:hypothetical protein
MLNKKKEKKNEMTRILSGRNRRFMYIYMLISDQLRGKKTNSQPFESSSTSGK